MYLRENVDCMVILILNLLGLLQVEMMQVKIMMMMIMKRIIKRIVKIKKKRRRKMKMMEKRIIIAITISTMRIIISTMAM